MANNVDSPNGFQYSSLFQGHPPLIEIFEKQVGYGTAIFQCDVVKQIAGVSGFNKAPIEAFGTPGTLIPLGVSQNYGAVSTRTRHSVIVDPMARYHAQDDGDTDGLVAADMGLNALVSLGAGSTQTGFSGHEIDEAGIATSATATDLHLLGLFPMIGNDFGSSHVRVIVTFNRIRRAQNTAGV